jgi:hypothetical protein
MTMEDLQYEIETDRLTSNWFEVKGFFQWYVRFYKMLRSDTLSDAQVKAIRAIFGRR